METVCRDGQSFGAHLLSERQSTDDYGGYG